MNNSTKFKHYVFSTKEKEIIKEFCKLQFSNITTDRLANNIDFLINGMGKFLKASISPNYNHASYNGIIYPIFIIDYKYPMNYKLFLKKLKESIYTVHQIAKQINDSYVWAYFLIIAAECKYTIEWEESWKFSEILKIFYKFMIIPKFTEKILKIIFYNENTNKDIKDGNKVSRKMINKWLDEKLKGTIPMLSPIKGQTIWPLFLAGENKKIALKNGFIYKQIQIKQQEIKNKVLNSFNYISRKYSFVFPFILASKNIDNYKLFNFLALTLIFLSKIQTSFSKFLTLKLRKNSEILVGDFIKLCNELKI